MEWVEEVTAEVVGGGVMAGAEGVGGRGGGIDDGEQGAAGQWRLE